MNLYIEIENGIPKNHPVTEENLIQLYESVENIPEKFKPFVRHLQYVTCGPYQKPVNTYEEHNSVWQDVWTATDLEGDELLARKQEIYERSVQDLPLLIFQTKRIIMKATDENGKKTAAKRYLSILENLELTVENPLILAPPSMDSSGNWYLNES